MLKDDLPKIITDKLPGPKASLVIENRKKYIPNAIGCIYPVWYLLSFLDFCLGVYHEKFWKL